MLKQRLHRIHLAKISLAKQGGALLLEALISILIFSMGILAIVAMQTAAVKASSEAKYRSDAGQLANRLIGEMWVSDRTAATLQNQYQGGAGVDGAAYTTWLAEVQATLPGVADNPPTVTVASGTNSGGSLVTITVFWKAPSEADSTTPHQYVTTAQIF